MSTNKEFWRTIREEIPKGRIEFYDERTKAQGIAVIIDGRIVSVMLKEGPAGFMFTDWKSITHWRPDGQTLRPR